MVPTTGTTPKIARKRGPKPNPDKHRGPLYPVMAKVPAFVIAAITAERERLERDDTGHPVSTCALVRAVLEVWARSWKVGPANDPK